MSKEFVDPRVLEVMYRKIDSIESEDSIDTHLCVAFQKQAEFKNDLENAMIGYTQALKAIDDVIQRLEQRKKEIKSK